MGRKNRGRNPYRDPKLRDSAEIGTIPDEFINFYKSQLVPSSITSEEFDEVLRVMKVSLPHVFRLSSLSPSFERLQKELEQHLEHVKQQGIEVVCLDFLDQRFGPIYKLSIDKPGLRKNENLQSFRNWLHSHTESGDCVRQEFVSMLPPYFLDVKPGQSILDCCASPGSKTSQATEMLISQSGITQNGLVIANDVEPSRCSTLIHQLNRFETPHVIVTCYPAQQFPEITKFDRIICDVPCSGDGTFRKNPDAGPKWKVHSGTSLHILQRSILIKALSLLKPGGRLVYSTCSMNPLENEAVINSVYHDCEGTIDIVDVSNQYPGLKRSKGLSQWKVYYDQNHISSFEDVPSELKDKYSASMFSTNVTPKIERCMRFLPHQNDSGAFFVTVIEKLEEKSLPIPLSPKVLSQWRQPPFLPLLESNSEIFATLKEEYGLDDSFCPENLFIRDDDSVRNIFYLTHQAGEIARKTDPKTLRAFSSGTRVFSWKSLNNDTAIKGIPCYEGVGIVFHAATRRKYSITPKDMKLLLEAGNEGANIETLSPESQAVFKTANVGGCIVYVEGTKYIYGAMRKRSAVSLHIKKEKIQWEVLSLVSAFPEINQ